MSRPALEAGCQLLDERLGEPPILFAKRTGRIPARVEAGHGSDARQRQGFEGTDLLSNADMGPAEVRRYCPVDDAGRNLLRAAMQQLHMSTRAYHRILKLARTIADLRPDAVHLTGPHLWNRGVLAALRRVGVPAAHTLHDLDPHFGTVYGPLLYVWNRGVLALADGILVHGVRYQARLREMGLAEERVTCAPLMHLFLGDTRLADAMAASRPVVCTDVPVMRENVVDGGTGILVPPSDPQAMRAAILSLLRDPELGDAMGRAARARYEERHTLPAFAQRVRGILADLTQARQS